ncbi:MAG: hypothetical protein J0I41_20990 [Filimonas sp.]|nr:hypothetical protein [Filimonas sp.]
MKGKLIAVVAILSVVIAFEAGCNNENNGKKSTVVKNENANTSPVIDTLHAGTVTLYVSAATEQEYQQVPRSGFDAYAHTNAEEPAIMAAAGGAIARNGRALVITAANGKVLQLINREFSDEELQATEPSSYTCYADLKNMGYWLIAHSVPDFSNWIFVNKQTGDTSQVMAYGAISPSGKYYMATLCGGEGSPCNNGELYLYENKQSKMALAADVELMPGKVWMPDEIKWISDTKAVAKVKLAEDEEGNTIADSKKPMPQYVVLEMK